MNECFEGASYTTMECSIKQLEDANANNFTQNVIKHKIEENVAKNYGSKFEIFVLLNQG